MGSGYDYATLYEQVHRMENQSVIAYNMKNERGSLGFDEHFVNTCFREHSYRYDNFYAKYTIMKLI